MYDDVASRSSPLDLPPRATWLLEITMIKKRIRTSELARGTVTHTTTMHKLLYLTSRHAHDMHVDSCRLVQIMFYSRTSRWNFREGLASRWIQRRCVEIRIFWPKMATIIDCNQIIGSVKTEKKNSFGELTGDIGDIRSILTTSFRKPRSLSPQKRTIIQPGDAFRDNAFELGFEIVKF
jgi:hypothetical protein